MRRTPTAVAAALLAAAPLLAGCTGDPGTPTTPAVTRPETEVALPILVDAGKATTPYPTSTVTLAVGQRFGVKGVDSMTAWTWALTSTGDGAVLRQGPDVVIDPCGGGTGCSPGIDQTFTALAPGTTTLTWEFQDRGACPPSPAPHPTPRCGEVTKSIQVTVH
ncbi:hypothetical protein ACH4E7_25115 [Kitasatospora sp. NPDC018058]|uniref:hypothetical protein n=1 Tax=Kitasatospora sp. NPDC018058 TaxID=3364025 RepID=UPI0037BF769B